METFIYALIDPRDSLIKYIGKSNNPEKRLYNHIYESKKGLKTKKCNWIRKLQNENKSPILKILEICNVEDWQEREKILIKEYKPCTNHKEGGGGTTYNPQTENSKIINQYDLDGNFIKEYPSLNECARQTGLELGNISNVCNGKLRHTGYFIFRIKGEKYQDRTVKKAIRQERRVLQLDKKGNLIREFENIQDAVKSTNTPRTSISNCCFSNEQGLNRSAYGFIWKFKDKIHLI